MTGLVGVADVGAKLQRRFRNNAGAWLTQAYAGKGWEPISCRLKPAKAEVLADIAAYRAWLADWRHAAGRSPSGLRLEFESVSWHQAGVSEVLSRVEILTVEGAFSLMPDGEALGRAHARALCRLRRTSDGIAEGLLNEPQFVLESSEDEFDRLRAVASWLLTHERADCFIRELPIEGVGTKWLERNRALVASVLSRAMHLPEPLRAADIESRWGIRSTPALFEMRHADIIVPGLPAEAPVALPLEALLSPRTLPRKVAVVENLQTGLSLRIAPDTLVVMGMGAAIEAFSKVPWVSRVPVLYMGDLDQDGVRILARLRRHLPAVRSILMDCTTLERFRHLCIRDETRLIRVPAEGLTAGELMLLERLQAERLRLEQERIPLELICEAFSGN